MDNKGFFNVEQVLTIVHNFYPVFAAHQCTPIYENKLLLVASATPAAAAYYLTSSISRAEVGKTVTMSVSHGVIAPFSLSQNERAPTDFCHIIELNNITKLPRISDADSLGIGMFGRGLITKLLMIIHTRSSKWIKQCRYSISRWNVDIVMEIWAFHRFGGINKFLIKWFVLVLFGECKIICFIINQCKIKWTKYRIRHVQKPMAKWISITTPGLLSDG